MRTKSTEERAKPLVSVVIPTCNRADLLKRAVNSVVGQTYAHLEIVVVDDASADNTQEIVRGFKDDRIRYLRHDNNRGGSEARNTGIDFAKGEYVAFLDDDDTWLPNMVEKQLSVLKKYDAVLCTCYMSGKSMAKRRPETTISREQLKKSPYAIGGTGVFMGRTSIVKYVRFDGALPIHQDWDFFIRVAHQCEIAYLNVPLLHYNVGQHERITNKRASMTANEFEPQFRMLEKHKSFLGSRWYRRHMAGVLLYGFFKHRSNKMHHLAYTLRRCGAIAVARVFAKRAFQVVSRCA